MKEKIASQLQKLGTNIMMPALSKDFFTMLQYSKWCHAVLINFLTAIAKYLTNSAIKRKSLFGEGVMVRVALDLSVGA